MCRRPSEVEEDRDQLEDAGEGCSHWRPLRAPACSVDQAVVGGDVKEVGKLLVFVTAQTVSDGEEAR